MIRTHTPNIAHIHASRQTEKNEKCRWDCAGGFSRAIALLKDGAQLCSSQIKVNNKIWQPNYSEIVSLLAFVSVCCRLHEQVYNLFVEINISMFKLNHFNCLHFVWLNFISQNGTAAVYKLRKNKYPRMNQFIWSNRPMGIWSCMNRHPIASRLIRMINWFYFVLDDVIHSLNPKKIQTSCHVPIISVVNYINRIVRSK